MLSLGSRGDEGKPGWRPAQREGPARRGAGPAGIYSKPLEGFNGGVTCSGFSFQKICLWCGQWMVWDLEAGVVLETLV